MENILLNDNWDSCQFIIWLENCPNHCDTNREVFYKHPWTIGGGGASELKNQLDNQPKKLSELMSSAGFMAIVGDEDVYLSNNLNFWTRQNISKSLTRPLIDGAAVRDWMIWPTTTAVFDYDHKLEWMASKVLNKHFWRFRALLQAAPYFGKTKAERGMDWREYAILLREKMESPLSIVFANVSSHTHFGLEESDAIGGSTAQVIKLKSSYSKEDYLNLLGILNSSVSCFWLKQVSHDKGGGGIGGGIAAESWERFKALNARKFKAFPIPFIRKLAITSDLYNLSIYLSNSRPEKIIKQDQLDFSSLNTFERMWSKNRKLLIFLQEELDWHVYNIYNLISDNLVYESGPIEIDLGQRAFEIVMARKMKTGELETSWFERHNSVPITDIPSHWPEDYKNLIKMRISTIEKNPRTVGLIEKPEYKRRWNLETWDSQLVNSLKNFLLDRIESYFDFDGRLNDEGTITAMLETTLTTANRLADIARNDQIFMNVAELYCNRPDFDIAGLVANLVESESVPFLKACRYRATGMDKRSAWERTWRLQKIEDSIDNLFDAQRLNSNEVEYFSQQLKNEILHIINQLKENLPKNSNNRDELLILEEWLNGQVSSALRFIQELQEEGTNLYHGRAKHKLSEFMQSSKNKLIGDIPVPPKYAAKDFQDASYWRLRGKLDVPKERWVSFPHCEGEDGSMVIAWAGYDHLQLAQAISAYYVDVQERTGGSEDPRLEVLLACMLEVLPWVKQWHNDVDPEFNIRMGDYYQGFIADEARRLGKSIEEIKAWQPPKQKPKRRKRKATRKN